jgi:hypothetical protein
VKPSNLIQLQVPDLITASAVSRWGAGKLASALT